MSRAILKWLTALGVGAAFAAASYLTEAVGQAGPTGDILIDGAIVAALTRIIGFLVSKLPAS